MKVKEVMEYRLAFINNLLIQLFAYTVTLININLLLKNVGRLNGWSFSEVLLLWALNVLSYGITGLFIYSGCGQLESFVQSGKFDRYLTKPKSVFWCYMMDHINPVFCLHIMFSIVILIYTFQMNNVELYPLRALQILVLLACAVCIQACVMIVMASFSFWIVKSGNIVNTAVYGLRNFTTYPLSIYGKGLKFVLVFIVPYAFVSYFPALCILDKAGNSYESAFIILEPVFTVIFIIITRTFWNLSMKKYSSTGN